MACGCLVAAALLPGHAIAQETGTQVDRAITAEVQRNRQLGRSLRESRDQLEILLDDLRSNSLHDDDGSRKLEVLSATLARVTDEHAVRVSELLRKARDDHGTRAQSLSGAMHEITVVISQLREVMDEADLEQKKRVFGALLQEVVEHQWALLKDTVVWGRESMTRPKDTTARGEDLRLGQELALEKLASFMNGVNDTMLSDDNEALNEILDDVSAAIRERRVAFHQQNAADALGEGDAAAATGEEQEALAGLQDALDILNGVEWEELQRLVTEAELKEKIREIIEKEKALRLDVLRVTDAELPARSGPLAARQDALAEDLAALRPDIEETPSKAVLGPAVEIALGQMAKASDDLRAHKTEPAAVAQLRVITTLEDAMRDDLDFDIADVPYQPIPLGLGDFGMLPGMEGMGGMNVPEGAGIGMGPGLGIGLAMGGGAAGMAFGAGGMGPPGMGGEAGMGMGEMGLGMGAGGEMGMGMEAGMGMGMGMGEMGGEGMGGMGGMGEDGV
ncbi:MAG: hypothetical protein HQ559_12040, partial [Lentisphaerae bacterium]|nr:hypothetical protein [Lentisphaerota bacterium]